MGIWPYKFNSFDLFVFCFHQSKMGNSQSISLLTYGVDDTVLPSDPVNVNFRNFIDNFTDIDDGLYVEDDELLDIVFNIISKDVVLRSILNMVIWLMIDWARKTRYLVLCILERVTVVEFSPSSIGFLRSVSILKE